MFELNVSQRRILQTQSKNNRHTTSSSTTTNATSATANATAADSIEGEGIWMSESSLKDIQREINELEVSIIYAVYI